MPKKNGPVKIIRPDGTTELRKASSFQKKAKPYWKTQAWKKRRRAALERDDYRCCHCRRRQGDEDLRLKRGRTRLEVHHLTYERYMHEPLEDLQTLCTRCHANEHQWLKRQGRPLQRV